MPGSRYWAKVINQLGPGGLTWFGTPNPKCAWNAPEVASTSQKPAATFESDTLELQLTVTGVWGTPAGVVSVYVTFPGQLELTALKSHVRVAEPIADPTASASMSTFVVSPMSNCLEGGRVVL